MITYPQFNPIALQLGPIKIYWYGIMYVVAFLTAWTLARLRARYPHENWDNKAIDDLLFYAALGVVLGGRLGYMLFYSWQNLLQDPLSLFKTWQGGMSFHGGLLGVCCGMWLFQRKHPYSFLQCLDFIAPLVPLGLAVGRLGNFINGELWGRVSDVPWAMIFPHAGSLARHPSQLYEALGEGLALFLLLWWYARQPRQPGRIAGLFLIGYAMIRFSVEFFRQPDWQIGFIAFGWLTEGQLLCVPMLLMGAWLLYRTHRN